MKVRILLGIVILLSTLTSCFKDEDVYNEQKFSFEFNTGTHGWTGDFADYPVTDSVFYELEFAHANLPAPLNTERKSLKISGNNHSDDLFMFIKRKFTGLLPNTAYQILFDVELASNAPTNAIGVGGPPGESVGIKVGATRVEPKKIVEDGNYLMNIDKANQSQSGKDMKLIGHVGVSDTTSVFTLIRRTNNDVPFWATTDSEGAIWVIIGTESGFEATTTLYYKKIDVAFR
jgi:hypothetical protein